MRSCTHTYMETIESKAIMYFANWSDISIANSGVHEAYAHVHNLVLSNDSCVIYICTHV